MTSTNSRPPQCDRVHGPQPWVSGPFLGFDTETTGVNPLEDRLVTAALIHRGPRQPDGSRNQEVRQWLADPGVPIPPGASAIHGITTERARAQGRPIGEVLDEVATELAEAMSAGVPVVAFNASYDLTLLERELARHGLPTLRQRLGGPVSPVLDPLVLDRAVDRYRKGKRRLDVMCEVYGVAVDGDMHAADVDVIATLDVLEALLAAYPQVGMRSLEQVHEFQVRSHQQWAASFNDYLTRVGRTPDADESWPLDSAVG